MDYYRLEETTKARQLEALEAQMDLSFELKKPLMIHCRNAFRDLIDFMTKNKSKLNDTPGIIHFFTGTPGDAEELKALGFYFSFGGVTTFTRDYDAAIKKIGLDRIVLETDAPYVTPTPFRGKRNEPSYLIHTAEAIGKVLEVSGEIVAEKTTENARKVLKIN